MLRRNAARGFALATVLTVFAPACGSADTPPASVPRAQVRADAASRTNDSDRVEDGLYAVLREAPTREGARVDADHAVLVDDGRFSGEPQEVRYLALAKADHVPLVLEGAPREDADGEGRRLVRVTLAKSQVGPLGEFTRAHLGSRAAVVLDGEVVSVHKIRSVIEGGALQISYCSGNACDVLRSRLAN